MDQVTDAREPVAAEDISSRMETDYLLRPPKNARRLREAIARADAGQGEPADLEELRWRLGLVEE